MDNEKVDFKFFDNCSSLSDAARKIFGRDNYRDCEKIKILSAENGFDWKIWNERRKLQKKAKYCLCCGKEIKGKDSRNKFCCRSCAAKYNNKKRGLHPLIEHMKCEFCGKDMYNKQYGTRFCSRKCQTQYEQKEYIEKWKKGEIDGVSGKYGVSVIIKRYLFSKYDCKCEKCGWNEVNPTTGRVPLQIHHIDGNCLNNKEENLQLLCPNCHSLTETFGSLNKDSKRVFRVQKGNI